MITMLNRLMTSRRVRGFLLTVLILSALVAVLSVAVPLNRKKEAIQTLGSQSVSETTSLALSPGILQRSAPSGPDRLSGRDGVLPKSLRLSCTDKGAA